MATFGAKALVFGIDSPAVGAEIDLAQTEIGGQQGRAAAGAFDQLVDNGLAGNGRTTVGAFQILKLHGQVSHI